MKKKQNIILGFVAAVAVLSGCGRNDYNGTYEGYETSTQTGAANGQVYGMNTVQPDYVTLTLSQNGETVSGNYTAKNSGVQGTFMASANSANRLDNVRLTLSQTNNVSNPNGFNNFGINQGAYCPGLYTGTLTAADDARRLNGTLTMYGATTQANTGNYYNSLCSGKTLDLSKSNNR